MLGAFLIFFFSWIPGPDRILEIVVEGNQFYSAEEIRGSIYTKAGEPLNAKTLQQDLIFLWQNKRVRADVYSEPVPGGIRLIFRVEEVPALREVSIRGNQKIERADLFDAAKITPGVPIDLVVASRAKSDLIQYYRDQGYFFADVKLVLEKELNRAVFEIMEGPLVKVSSIEFEGNQSIPSSYFLNLRRSLGSAMKTHDGFLFFASSEFKENVLREDLIQLRRLYRREGFRDAVVEVKDLEFNEEHDRVTVHVFIDEGPRYFIESVDIEGNESFPKEELLPLIKLKPGDPYNGEIVERDRWTLTQYYGERGYPAHPSIQDHWEFQEPKEIFSTSAPSLRLVYRIQEGKKIKVRDIQIRGNEATQDRVIRRHLTFFPGDIVNTAEISKSLQRLNGLNYFADERGFPGLNFSFVDTDKPDEKDVVVQVSEGPTGRFNIGGGVNSVEGLFANVLLQKSNFDLFDPPSSWGNTFKEIFDGTAFTGAGQDLTLSLAPGTRVSTFNFRFREPDLFGDHIKTTTFDFNLFRRRRFFQEYEEDRGGLILSLGKNWTPNWGTYLNFHHENITLKRIELDAPSLIFDIEGDNTLRSVGLDLVHSVVDLPLDPNEGYVIQLSGELGGGFLGGDFDFYKGILSNRVYIPLSRDDRGRPYTLMLRGMVGSAKSFGDSPDLPFPVRFFTGGPDSIRGFSFRGVGPVQNNHPTGGEFVGLAGAELRFPVYSTPFADGLAETEWIRGVFFVDAGSLGLDMRDPTFREWRMSAGTGVRIKLPFMPQAAIILDYGVPLFRQETDSRRNFSFSIGASF